MAMQSTPDLPSLPAMMKPLMTTCSSGLLMLAAGSPGFAGTPVAVAHTPGISEYYVSSRGVWSYVRPLASLSPHPYSLVYREGYLYATVPGAGASVQKFNAATGEGTVLATRGVDTPGWAASDPQGMECGPDGKLYFATAFATAGEGVFRIGTDGSGFSQVLTRTGGAGAGAWDLNNARDLAWNGNDLLVSSRSGFSTTNRPIYRFRDGDGDGVRETVENLTPTGVTAPQGIVVDGNVLYGVNTAGRVFRLDPAAVPPAAVTTVATIAGRNLMDAEVIEGVRYVIDNNGVIHRLNADNSVAVAIGGLGTANDLVALPETDTDTDGLGDTWERLYFAELSQGAAGDPDADSFSNLLEFQAGSNPLDPGSRPDDADSDGLPDVWELASFGNLGQNAEGDFDRDGAFNGEEYAAGTKAADAASQPDSDADGMPDGTERQWFGGLMETGTGDFDGDGAGNAAELAAGSNPTRRGSTPATLNEVALVAVATNAGLDEWTVQQDVWTWQRSVSPGELSTVTVADGVYYGVAAGDVVRIDPQTGARTVLASRGQAGWNDSSARDMELGPDGWLYFTTAFGASLGEGVFRLRRDGTGFTQFIPRIGGEFPDDWDLNNSIGLAWKDGKCYVSTRSAVNSTGRPVYRFRADGAYDGRLSESLSAPMGLFVDGNELAVGGAVNAQALTSLSLLDGSVIGTRSGIFSIDVIEVQGELHAITFNSGTSGAGSVLKAGRGNAMTVVNANLGSPGNDFVLVPPAGNPDSDGDGLRDAWEIQYFGNVTAQSGHGDPDGDGSSNRVEQALALDPTNGAQRYHLALVAGELRWPAAAGITFTVRSSENLADWTKIEAQVTATGPLGSWALPLPLSGRKFYRVDFNP